MTDQVVLVDRFCAIEGAPCRKEISFNGPWTFFFAYPGNPAMDSFSHELTEELNSRGYRGTRWADLVSNDLLFSKVCEGIHANDFLLAEITEPNANVQMEIGYALAVGRQPILLQNNNRHSWHRELLRTLESCFYSTREDIHSYLSEYQKRSDVPSDPSRNLPFLENMGFYDYREVRGMAYHLKPKISTDWISRVDRVVKSSVFELTSMDPSDSVYEEFFPQARQIQRASLIIASFVSQDTIDWQRNNAHVALLAGFAIGLGKQVLVLQEEPIAPILDLGSVSRAFESESQVREIVRSWIERQTRISVHESLALQRRSYSAQQADVLRRVYLGHPDALQDTELLNYFIPTKEFRDALEGQRTIFIGRRGSGKSANFQGIRAEISGRPNIINIEITPDDFQLERISDFLDHEIDLHNPQLIFQSIWNHVLTTEILKSLEEKTDHLYYSPDDSNRNRLRQIFDDSRDNLEMDFGSRVVSALREVLISDPSMSPIEIQRNAEEAIKSLRNYDLGSRLRAFARREGITFFIIADDLDKFWRPNTKQSIELLIGLIAEVSKMQQYFQECLKIVLFFREGIYDVLTIYDEDLSKRDIVRIEWTSANLRHLVAERLATKANMDDLDDDEIWSAIFPEQVDGVPASDYILTRSLPRPRDVLNLCQKAIDQAQRNGHSHVTVEDILDGERSFSEALFYSVTSEFNGMYPDLGEVLSEFIGAPEKMAWSEFEERADRTIRSNEAILASWVGGEHPNPHFLAEVLFRIGLVGLSREWDSRIHFSNGRTFSETLRLSSSRPLIHFHHAFIQFLEISEAVLRPPIPSSRRRRRVSPLQLPLDVERE